MPFQHTTTELTVAAQDQAKASAVINIGMQIVQMAAVTGTKSADELYAERKIVLEEDALAIYSLLHRHLPEETLAKLTSLFRNLGTRH